MRLDALKPADAVILAVAHEEYVAGGWPMIARLLKGGNGVVLDIKGKLDRSASRPASSCGDCDSRRRDF